MRLSSFYLPVDHLSSTMLSVAVTCPEQFRRRYILREPDRMNVAKLVGSAVHGALADNWRWKLEKGDDLPDQAIMQRLQGAWDHTIEMEGEPEWKEPPQLLQATCSKMLGLYMSEVAPQVTPIATEQRFEEQIPGLPVPLTGVIDLETKSLIREVKTTTQKVTKPKPRWRLQTRIYQLQTRKPVEHQVVTRQVTPKLYTSASEPELLTPVTNPDVTVLILQRAVTTLNDLYARYGRDEPWPPNGVFHDWLCSYCSYRSDCVGWRDLDQAPD